MSMIEIIAALGWLFALAAAGMLWRVSRTLERYAKTNLRSPAPPAFRSSGQSALIEQRPKLPVQSRGLCQHVLRAVFSR